MREREEEGRRKGEGGRGKGPAGGGRRPNSPMHLCDTVYVPSAFHTYPRPSITCTSIIFLSSSGDPMVYRTRENVKFGLVRETPALVEAPGLHVRTQRRNLGPKSCSFPGRSGRSTSLSRLTRPTRAAASLPSLLSPSGLRSAFARPRGRDGRRSRSRSRDRGERRAAREAVHLSAARASGGQGGHGRRDADDARALPVAVRVRVSIIMELNYRN
jgi:hypothetical protein